MELNWQEWFEMARQNPLASGYIALATAFSLYVGAYLWRTRKNFKVSPITQRRTPMGMPKVMADPEVRKRLEEANSDALEEMMSDGTIDAKGYEEIVDFMREDWEIDASVEGLPTAEIDQAQIDEQVRQEAAKEIAAEADKQAAAEKPKQENNKIPKSLNDPKPGNLTPKESRRWDHEMNNLKAKAKKAAAANGSKPLAQQPQVAAPPTQPSEPKQAEPPKQKPITVVKKKGEEKPAAPPTKAEEKPKEEYNSMFDD